MQSGEFSTEYSDSLFWNKIRNQAAMAGATVIYASFIAYYTLNSEKLSSKIKAMLYGALGYFIAPLDVIPDITPAVGYADDFAVITAVIKVLEFYISKQIKEKAKNKVRVLFGDGDALEAISQLHINTERSPSARL